MNIHLLDLKQEDLLQSCIRDFYLKRERPSVAALIREVKRRFSEEQLPIPAYRTVCRRIEALDLHLVIRKREGSKKAYEKLGPVLVSILRADLPMDIVQIDHTRVDVIVVDRERRQPIGRPWLTLAIDIASRTVVGFSVSLEARHFDAAGNSERWLALQIAGVYHLSPHSALEKTPLAAWQEGLAKRKQPLRYPASAEEFFLDFLPAVPRRIQRDGIHFHKRRRQERIPTDLKVRPTLSESGSSRSLTV